MIDSAVNFEDFVRGAAAGRLRFGGRPLAPRSLILFGSRACGLAGDCSDYDVVIIADSVQRPQRVVASAFDVALVPGEQRALDDWWQTELGLHVARFGIALSGPRLTPSSLQFEPAAARKRDRVTARLVSLARSWHHLSDAHRRRYVAWLGYDLERFVMLSSDRPVPPTRVVAQEWAAHTTASRLAVVSALAPICPNDSAMHEIALRLSDETFSPEPAAKQRPWSSAGFLRLRSRSAD